MSTDKQRSAQMNKSGKKTKCRETRRISILKRAKTQPERAPEMQKLNPSTCANSQKPQKRHAFLTLYLCLSVLICGSISPLLGQAPAKAPPAREKIDLLVAGGTVRTATAPSSTTRRSGSMVTTVPPATSRSIFSRAGGAFAGACPSSGQMERQMNSDKHR